MVGRFLGGPRWMAAAATRLRPALLAAAFLGLALGLAAPPAIYAAPVGALDDGAPGPADADGPRGSDAGPTMARISDEAKPPADDAAEDTDAGAPAPSSTGQLIAGFAAQFQGYPYAWAGNTPAGFDCSGFTQYVVLSTLGVDIGHAVEGQPAAGWLVDWGAWLPGDLVFFQNTYRAGVSHVGIYLGDGLFIHAENEGTGVVVTSIHSGYYAAHYWGAVRVG